MDNTLSYVTASVCELPFFLIEMTKPNFNRRKAKNRQKKFWSVWSEQNAFWGRDKKNKERKKLKTFVSRCKKKERTKKEKLGKKKSP